MRRRARHIIYVCVCSSSDDDGFWRLMSGGNFSGVFFPLPTLCLPHTRRIGWPPGDFARGVPSMSRRVGRGRVRGKPREKLPVFHRQRLSGDDPGRYIRQRNFKNFFTSPPPTTVVPGVHFPRPAGMYMRAVLCTRRAACPRPIHFAAAESEIEW